MKRQRIFLLALTIIIVCSLLLTSCTFVQVNEERQANEVLATVSLEYEGQTLSLNVTRNELLSYVNYLINLYSQYQMQYDVKDLLTGGLDGLISQKYSVLEGMVYLISLDNRKDVMYLNTDEYKAIYGNSIVPEGVLTIAERYKSISETNNTFIESIDGYITSYEEEQREILLSSAKEKLNAYYQDGYTVDGVEIYNYSAEDETYEAGLYQDSFIYVAPSDNSTETVETDYKQIYLQITLNKSGADDMTVYFPVNSTAVTTAEKDLTTMTTAELIAYKSSAAYKSNSVSLKTVSVNYDEPVKEEGAEDYTYKSHTAKADFTLVTPRTAYTEAEEEDTRNEQTIFTEGDVPFRYTELSANDEAQKKIIQDGQIFKHTLVTYSSDAEKDAYRQFRESKKEQLIGFDAADTSDPYNGLSYYYNSSFESAILAAVKHEITKTSLSENPITEAQIQKEYDNFVAKQKEEYQILTKQKQVEKFAEIIKTDLTKCYYVPIDALLTSEFEYDGTKYTYATAGSESKVTINMFYIAHILFKWTTDLSDSFKTLIEDRTDEEVKQIKTNFVQYLTTNKSKIAYESEGVIDGVSALEAAFEVEEANGDIKEYLANTIIAQLTADLNTSEDPLATFKDYMSLYNDDGGSMRNALGYFVAMGDIAHSYDGDDFPNMAKDLYLSLLANSENPNSAKSISNYAFTSYGMHIEYISFAPFYDIVLTNKNALGLNFELDLDGNTFYETIKASLEETLETNVYSEWTGQFDNDDIKNNHSTKNEKKLKQLIKDLNLD